MPHKVVAVSHRLQCRWAPGCPLTAKWAREGGSGTFKEWVLWTAMRNRESVCGAYPNKTCRLHSTTSLFIVRPHNGLEVP